NNEILATILSALEIPLISTSVSIDDIGSEVFNMDLIEKKYEHLVDFIIDGQIDTAGETTVLDCTSGDVEVIREGIGLVD
ncbi:MAG TPA: Sua5/YciO/YrdC/YwlC family protein, partial [Saprospiraceae bacterium]|nr:Sua5/YciO/YrdC/YwlC family protein [Saprospiraceae bacterium]